METSIVNLSKGILYVILSLFITASLVNCGNSSSQGSAGLEAPKAMIQDYVAKHETMIDESIVEFYVRDEQPYMAAAVKKNIDEKKAAGELEKLRKATFDFSDMKISVVGETEEYIDDQPIKMIKVTLSGSYIMNMEDSKKTIPAEETIIMGMVDSSWKVTERIDPWS